MLRSHLAEVLALEARAFDDPWTEAHFVGELNNRVSHVDLLRDVDGVLCGYIVYWIVVDQVEILDVATDPDRRRRGLGRRLVEHVRTEATRQDCVSISLEVRRSNQAALALYEAAGFARIAVRVGYYALGNEDAIVMSLPLAGG